METAGFELIFQGLSEDSETSRGNLLKALKNQCVSQVFEVDSLLDGGPFLIKRSANMVDLEPPFQELQRAGAKVSIVRTRSKRDAEESSATELPGFRTFIRGYADGLAKVINALDVAQIEALVVDLLAARDSKRQIFVFGNGGSASTASHIVNDFTKQRFDDESLLFRFVGLNDNISWLTATANDFGYEMVFVNQLKNLLQPGDVVIGISSSGNSPNITRAIQYANDKGAITWGLVGFEGGELKKQAKKLVYIPTKVGQYGFHEDVTLIVNHMMSVYIYEWDRERVQQ